MNADEDDVVPLFEDITQQQMCLWPFEYHALSSAYRMATSSESYLRNIRNQKLNSAFVTSPSQSVAVAAASNDEQSATENSSCASFSLYLSRLSTDRGCWSHQYGNCYTSR